MVCRLPSASTLLQLAVPATGVTGVFRWLDKLLSGLGELSVDGLIASQKAI
jgi:hypothetical protein